MLHLGSTMMLRSRRSAGASPSVKSNDDQSQKSTTPGRKDDAPTLSRKEAIKSVLLAFVSSWLHGAPFLLIGAWSRDFTRLPRPWFGFWLFLATSSLSVTCSVVALLDRPRLLRERFQKKAAGANDSLAEQRFFKGIGIINVVGFVLIGRDASIRYENFPLWANVTGSCLIVVSFMWFAFVMRTNDYAAAVVYKQPGQVLITSGPYRVVRHPMYSGMILLNVGYPLCAGSFWGILPMSLFTILLAFRTNHEEVFLVETFGERYGTYRKEVRYRMVPLIF